MIVNAREDTIFQVKKFLRCRGKLLDLSTSAIMGILNITPDSFYDGGIYTNKTEYLKQAEKMLTEGAEIIDLGGQSSRPGAKMITEEKEWERVGPALQEMVKNFPEAVVSIDTFYPGVAHRAIQEGASIINDISGGDLFPAMYDVVLKNQVPYIIMHMKGTPESMQQNPTYQEVTSEILSYLVSKVTILRKLGLNDIIIDPGFGFGKSTEDNFQILKNLSLFKILNCPILAGISRKSMIAKTLNVKPEDALNGTTSLNTIALLNGASILRVHDVAEAIQVRNLVKAYKNKD
jgi:dihydropteroate synthase